MLFLVASRSVFTPVTSPLASLWARASLDCFTEACVDCSTLLAWFSALQPIPRLISEIPPKTATAKPTQRGAPTVWVLGESWNSLICVRFSFRLLALCIGGEHPFRQMVRLGLRTE